MFNNRGSSLVSTVLAIAAAGGVGVAGYYLVAGNCGSCDTKTAAATPVAAATDADADCGGCSADVMTVAATEKTDCATACSGEADVVVVANEAEGCATECATECTDEQKAECAEKSACSGEADAVVVANQAEACSGAEKTDCEKSCDGEAKVCPVTGQPIADAGN